MAGFRKLDAFAKTRPDLQQKSVVGGIITVVATTAAALLFVAQIFSYISGNTQHSLHLAKSTSIPVRPLGARSYQGRIPLHIHVTFPHLSCQQLDVNLDGASLSAGELSRVMGGHSITMKPPSKSDRISSGDAFKPGRGCTIAGKLNPQIVAGVLSISINRETWIQATRAVTIRLGADASSLADQLQQFNVSHYVHNIQFGDTPPLEKPLTNRAHWIHNEFGGIAVEFVQVKLIPTLFSTTFSSGLAYQMSVVDHTINPATLVTKGVPYLPGLVITYDFTPLAVHHSSGRDNFLVFLSSLISIVGGVFVTVGLFTGCLVASAQVVAKKID
jgi:hypothetical protein